MISLALGAVVLLTLAACGSDGAATASVQTATAGAASDSATVTAFVSGRASATAGAGGVAATPRGASTTTSGAGGKNGFLFATLPAAANTSGGGTAAARTPGASQGAAPTGSVSGSTYTDGRGRFRFTIPQGWETQSASQSGVDVQAAPTGQLDGLLQITSDSGSTISLDDYALRVQNGLKGTVTNFQVVPNSTQNATIGGEQARRFEFTGTLGGTSVHSVVFVVRKGATTYGMILVATQADYDAVIAQAKIITDTFTFL